MANQRSRKTPAKTESLTIRLDPKMRFALEFVARLNGQTITKVIERAVTEAADRAKVDDGGNSYDAPNWRAYWDVNEGVRSIRIAMDQNTHPTFDEEEMLDFVRCHWRFFSLDPSLSKLRRDNIEIIWPRMSELLNLWRETKSTDDRRMARNLIIDALKRSGMSESNWTPPSNETVNGLDAEIPF